jgi:hypothetical protein
LHNNCISGDKNNYPTTFNGAYNLLSQYRTYGQVSTGVSQGTSFAQNSDRKPFHSGSGSDGDDDDDDKLRQAPRKYAE